MTRRYWPRIPTRIAGHRWAAIAKRVVESIGFTAAQSEQATFLKSIAESIGLVAAHAESAAFAKTRAEALSLTPAQSGSIGGAVTPQQDWINRSTLPGVKRALLFSSANVDTFRHPGTGAANIQWFPSDGIIGDGCLHLDIPASSGENPGAWRCPLDASWTTNGQGIGANDFYVQFRFKLGPNRLDPVNGAADGFKIFILGGYDFSSPASSSSHVDNEIVMQTISGRSIPAFYRDMHNTPAPENNSAEWFDQDGFPQPSDIRHQTAIDNGAGIADKFARYCLYQPGTPDDMSAGCLRMVTGIWYTGQIHVKVATPGGTAGNIFEAWIAGPDDAAFTKLYDMQNVKMANPDADLAPNGPAAIWFTGYNTHRTSGNADSYHRIDQLIVRDQFIPCPVPRALPAIVPSATLAWQTIPSSAISSVDPIPNPGGNPEGKITQWTSFAVDQRNSNIYSIANGGHNVYAGNEADKFPAEATTPSWAQLRAPSIPVADAAYYPDGRPTSRHTYYGKVFDAWSNCVRLLGGARWNNGNTITQCDVFDVGTNDWAVLNPTPSPMPNVPSAVTASGLQPFACCQDPYNGDIYVVGRNGAHHVWRRSTNTWATLTTAPFDGENTTSAFDTKRKRILYAGGSSPSPGHHIYTLSTGTWSSITITGGTIGSECGMFYVESQDAYYARDGIAGGSIQKVNASTFALTNLSTTGGTGIPAHATEAVYRRWLWVERLKSAVYCPDHGSPMWIVRLVP